MAFMLVDFSREQCNRRDIYLWFDFWGETQARPQFREIYAAFAAERFDCLSELVTRTQDRLPAGSWTVASFSQALDALSDGLWLELHMSKGRVIRREARRALARFIGSTFPSCGDSLMAMAEKA
jgi:TetR/AcrR family transcriptional repressor of bet genes